MKVDILEVRGMENRFNRLRPLAAMLAVALGILHWGLENP